MLGLCDYAKKQCWHNRAPPTVHCPDLTSSAPGHSGGQKAPSARCTRAPVREWTLETLETLHPAIYDYTVYQYVLNP